MHAMFPDWVRTLYPDTSVESLPIDAWWSAIEEFVTEASDAHIIGLCRAAHGRATPEFDTEWRQALRQHDPMSPLRDADRQVSVLAGAGLLHASEERAHAPVALYLRRCAAHVGWVPTLSDVALTDAELADAAMSVRTLEAWPQSRRATLQMRAVNEALAGSVEPLSQASLQPILEALAGSVNDLVSRSVTSLAKVAASREAPLLEQSDALVWLLAGRCALADRPWGELSAKSASVYAALEVRTLSRFALGRPDAHALISAAIDSASSAKSKTDANELCAAFEGSISLPRDDVSDLVPVSGSLIARKMLEVEPIEFGTRLHDELGLLKALRG